MRTICIFGDSIAVGHNAPSAEGWAHHLKKFVEERDPETQVVNCAERGVTTTRLLSTFEKECEKHKPQEIIFALGLNDTAYSFSHHRSLVLRDVFEKNVADLLAIAKKYAHKVVVVGIVRADERSSTFSDEKNNVFQFQNIVIQKYNDSLRGIAEAHQAIFIPVYDLLTDDELDDGFHPNASGHQKLFTAIRAHI